MFDLMPAQCGFVHFHGRRRKRAVLLWLSSRAGHCFQLFYVNEEVDVFTLSSVDVDAEVVSPPAARPSSKRACGHVR